MSTVIRISTLGPRDSFGRSAEPALTIDSAAHCPRTGKRRFPGRASAEAELNRLAVIDRVSDDVPIRAYRCRHCGNGWHLTHLGES